MNRSVAFVLVFMSYGAFSAGAIDLAEFSLNSGVAIGKAVGCKLDGPRIMRATKISFATINVTGKTQKARDDATRIFANSMDLGEAYIKRNGNAHCPAIDKTLDTIIQLGR